MTSGASRPVPGRCKTIHGSPGIISGGFRLTSGGCKTVSGGARREFRNPGNGFHSPNPSNGGARQSVFKTNLLQQLAPILHQVNSKMSTKLPRVPIRQATPFQRFTIRLIDGRFVRVPKSDLPSTEPQVDKTLTSNQTEIRQLCRSGERAFCGDPAQAARFAGQPGDPVARRSMVPTRRLPCRTICRHRLPCQRPGNPLYKRTHDLPRTRRHRRQHHPPERRARRQRPAHLRRLRHQRTGRAR